MSDRGPLIARFNALAAQSAAAFADAKSILAQGSGPRPLSGVVNDLTGKTVTLGQDTTYTELGLTPSGHIPAALRPRLHQDITTLYQNRTAMAQIAQALNPGFDLSPALFVGMLITMAAGGTIAGILGEGAAAASAGTAGAAASSSVPLETIGTEAAVETTAGAISTPIIETGGAVAAAGTAASALATSGGAASAVSTAVSDLTGSSTVGNIAGQVVSGASSLIGDVKSIFGPVADFAQTVLTDVENIDKNYIVPFTETISKDYNTINGLIGEVHTLANSGIQGILAIPSAISSALTSIDAANQRLAQMNGQINQGIAAGTLVPGIGGAISAPLADIHKTIGDAFATGVTEVGAVSKDTIDETVFATADLVGKYNEYIQGVGKAGWLGRIIAIVMQGWTAALGFLGSIEHILDYGRQAGRLENRVTPLDVAEIVKAWWRGQLPPDQIETELGRHGYDASRQQLLHDLEQWIPGIQDALKMFYRGVITSEELRSALSKQGLSDNDITALLDVILEPVDAREAVELDGRNTAAQAGFLQGSLASAAPDTYRALYPPNLRNPKRADFDWAAHWDIQNMDWWIRALWRGEATADEFKLAAQAHNVPPELIPHLEPVAAGVIELWMIPDMIATGVFSDQEATNYLRYLGHTPQSTEYILRYGKIKANAGAATDALQLAGLSAGAAAQMFRDGIINDSAYVEILQAHHMSPQAAALTVKLVSQEKAMADRRASARGLVKQADVGLITIDSMRAQMYQAGYTQQEIDNYTAEAESNTIAKAKFPTDSQIEKFWKAGILTDDQAMEALQIAGWPEVWASAFITLWSKPSATANPGG